MFGKRKVLELVPEEQASAKYIHDREVFAEIRRLLSPEEQLRVCLEDAGLPCSTASKIIGRAYAVDTCLRGQLKGMHWRENFWGKIEGIAIRDATILTLFLSHELLLKGNRSIRFDCFEKDKQWQSESWLTNDDSPSATRKFLTGLRLSLL